MSNIENTLLPEIPEYIGKLTAESSQVAIDIVTMDNSLIEYRSELDKLQKKHNVIETEKQIKSAQWLKSNLEFDLLKSSFQYVADCIHAVWNKLDGKRRDCLLERLSGVLSIEYETYWNHTDFGEFCDQELKKPYDHIQLTFLEGGTKLKCSAEYYFRRELYDKVKLVIPCNVLDDLSGFKVLMKVWYEEYRKEIEIGQDINQRNIDQRDYEEFLRLKKKFED